jgi:hypothetical protein
VLNRFGLVDGERLLSESDAGLRRLERRWGETGSDEDHKRYIAAVRRAGHDHHKFYMESHVREWDAADKEHREALMGSAFRASHKKRTADAKVRLKKATHAVNAAASEIGRHSGEFFEKREGEAPREHIGRLAALHGGGGNTFGAGRYTDGSDRFNFWHHHDAAKHAADLHKSVQHHYPHWKPKIQDWVQGDRVFHKAQVHFTSGDEWGKPHQPTERK